MFISFDSIGCVNAVSGLGGTAAMTQQSLKIDTSYIIIDIDVAVQILYNDLMWLILDF
jgi:hypothetical protein